MRCVDQVAEIMNLILAISHLSRLGSPLVFQPRHLLGGWLAQGPQGMGRYLESAIPLSTAHFPVRGQGERAPTEDWVSLKTPLTLETLEKQKKKDFFFFFLQTLK